MGARLSLLRSLAALAASSASENSAAASSWAARSSAAAARAAFQRHPWRLLGLFAGLPGNPALSASTAISQRKASFARIGGKNRLALHGLRVADERGIAGLNLGLPRSKVLSFT